MKIKLFGLILMLVLLCGCSRQLTVDCTEFYGNKIDGATIVYEERGWYVVSGGVYTQYTGVSIACTGCSSGVTNYEMVKIGTGIAGENIARKSDCLITSPGKERYKSLINQVLPQEPTD